VAGILQQSQTQHEENLSIRNWKPHIGGKLGLKSPSSHHTSGSSFLFLRFLALKTKEETVMVSVVSGDRIDIHNYEQRLERAARFLKKHLRDKGYVGVTDESGARPEEILSAMNRQVQFVWPFTQRLR
jgi:hypothetical protein